ncbi:hypothetical protein AB205_0158870 [Aquarana catesbeiana]|uniref:Uncharacterized protein n=1 Tax=Aquarana catesbeiana TaxID=8400 RepID=A0A2G9S9Z9_AQUCT|nr:hypothetical protein AB205_0158870 [Aquarana catesbeiana]
MGKELRHRLFTEIKDVPCPGDTARRRLCAAKVGRLHMMSSQNKRAPHPPDKWLRGLFFSENRCRYSPLPSLPMSPPPTHLRALSFCSTPYPPLNTTPFGENGTNYHFVVSGHCKTVPTLEYGFLVQIMKYAEQRLPTLNEYCVVCDEQHVFQNASMLKVVGLLVAMCRAALESPRKSIIFEPYPSVVDPNDPKTLAFNPKGSYLEIKKQMDRLDPLAHPLLQWIISSNRSHIVKLPLSRVKINKRKLMQPSHLKNSKLQNNKCLLLVLNTALRIVGGVMQIVALYPYVQQIENSQLNGECFIQLSYSFRLHSSPYY